MGSPADGGKLRNILQEAFTCAICLDVAVRPCTTTCGHTFCRRCLRSALSVGQNRCPSCRTALGRTGQIAASCIGSHTVSPPACPIYCLVRFINPVIHRCLQINLLSTRLCGQSSKLHSLSGVRPPPILLSMISPSGRQEPVVCRRIDHPPSQDYLEVLQEASYRHAYCRAPRCHHLDLRAPALATTWTRCRRPSAP